MTIATVKDENDINNNDIVILTAVIVVHMVKVIVITICQQHIIM